MSRIPVATLFACLLVSSLAAASELRPNHHEGQAAPTLEVALANLSEYNTRLEAILAADRPSPQDLGTIHELTYTLENALERISIDLEAMSEALETLHLASERADVETAKRSGAEYLQGARRLAP